MKCTSSYRSKIEILCIYIERRSKTTKRFGPERLKHKISLEVSSEERMLHNKIERDQYVTEKLLENIVWMLQRKHCSVSENCIISSSSGCIIYDCIISLSSVKLVERLVNRMW